MYVSYGCQIYSEGLVDWSGASIEGLSNSFYGYNELRIKQRQFIGPLDFTITSFAVLVDFVRPFQNQIVLLSHIRHVFLDLKKNLKLIVKCNKWIWI